MNLKINLNLDNAAFEDANEVGRILRELADMLDMVCVPDCGGRLADINGNTVGDWRATK